LNVEGLITYKNWSPRHHELEVLWPNTVEVGVMKPSMVIKGGGDVEARFVKYFLFTK